MEKLMNEFLNGKLKICSNVINPYREYYPYGEKVYISIAILYIILYDMPK